VWPSISANGNFSYINLSNNQLSGTIPKYNNNNLQYLYLNNNNFTEFKAQVLPNLLHLYVHFNNIQGTFPDLSNLVNLQILYANNNQFDDYDAGSLATLGSVAKIELSDNSFGSAAVNLIINDLYINYENNNRSGVIVNLGGNATPGVTAQQQIAYLQSNGWSIVTS
jgi:Leucine-rich repeat (LRR) protein